jgi:hypothetical protein
MMLSVMALVNFAPAGVVSRAGDAVPVPAVGSAFGVVGGV